MLQFQQIRINQRDKEIEFKFIIESFTKNIKRELRESHGETALTYQSG